MIASIIRSLAAACAVAALACSRGTAATPGVSPAAADSLRGVVRVAGSEPGTSIVLRTSSGAEVTLVGARDVLERLQGLEVRADGAPAGGRFRVERVAVRAWAGVPARDGILARDGERWVLETADGRRLPIALLPEALRGRAGARVWLAGPLDRAPAAFGIIAEAPER